MIDLTNAQFIEFIIQWDWNSLLDWDLVLAILMNINLIIIFRAVLTLYSLVAFCSLVIESTTHFLLPCHHFSNIHSTLLNSINEVLGSITKISDLSDCALVKILLFGDQNYTHVENACIINANIKYLVDSERFNGPLL